MNTKHHSWVFLAIPVNFLLSWLSHWIFSIIYCHQVKEFSRHELANEQGEFYSVKADAINPCEGGEIVIIMGVV